MICIFLCAPFFSSAQVNLGDSLLRESSYLKAAIAYELAFFEGMPSTLLNNVLLKQATCYKMSGKYDRALLSLERADFYSGSDSLRFLLYYEYAINAMLAKRYDLAYSKIAELYYELPKADHSIILPLEILCLNELQRWEEAHAKYQAFARVNNIAEDPYPEILAFKKKNPDKAFSLSFWMPGLGQMYAGYFWKGALSSMLNAGLITLSVWGFLDAYYFSGLFTGVALFYLSYNGGARYAEVLANQYNERKAKEFNMTVSAIVTGYKK